ncbi:hypothetical protein ACFU6K_09705 [Kitasatospora sp. NPDC057512]
MTTPEHPLVREVFPDLARELVDLLEHEEVLDREPLRDTRPGRG